MAETTAADPLIAAESCLKRGFRRVSVSVTFESLKCRLVNGEMFSFVFLNG